MKRACWLGLALAGGLFGAQPLVVVSVDGLDNRYLANADQLGLKIPNIRKLMREGQVSKGVVGVAPTITWPSHTTIITGADPVQHGILGNWRPPGERWLDYSQIKVPTLIGAAHDAKLSIATVDWPVTVNAPVDWNLPEYFTKRRGGGMDLKAIEEKAKPADLVKKIAAAMPSFAQEFMDDRTRTQAVVYLLQHEKPGLTLLHLVDLDSEAHDNAPYTREANAVLEYTDELIGHIVAAMPAGYALALVSDHGFERVNTMVNLGPVAAKEGVTNLVQGGGVLIAPDEKSATLVRQLAKDAGYGIGREIPVAELERFPSNQQRGVAAFEPADGFMFFRGPGTETFSKPQEIGNHGHWPMRYRAVYVLWGAAGQRGTIGEISMKEIAGRLAGVLGVRFP